jgi:hypothetical protein
MNSPMRHRSGRHGHTSLNRRNTVDETKALEFVLEAGLSRGRWRPCRSAPCSPVGANAPVRDPSPQEASDEASRLNWSTT